MGGTSQPGCIAFSSQLKTAMHLVVLCTTPILAGTQSPGSSLRSTCHVSMVIIEEYIPPNFAAIVTTVSSTGTSLSDYVSPWGLTIPISHIYTHSGAEDFPEVLPEAPPAYVYQPHYCHFFYSTLSINRERNLGTIVETLFNKQHSHTALKFTWEGSLRKKSCSSCCSRWWISIDGSACNYYERIETTIASSTAYDVFVPTTLTGICTISETLPIESGIHLIRLEVGNCPGSQISNTASGFFSTSRLIVEEIPQCRCQNFSVHGVSCGRVIMSID